VGWERRQNGEWYYYRARREGSRILKTYVGGGEKGRLAAEADRAARAALAAKRQQTQDDALRAMTTSLDEVDELADRLVVSQLLGLGWKQHHRQWRPSRNGYRGNDRRQA
jgi:hypothetical protein